MTRFQSLLSVASRQTYPKARCGDYLSLGRVRYSSSSSQSTTKPRIAIIGGGPGGLTLARILQRNGVQAKIYERESLENPRVQGGSLDLHGESGLAALRAAGLFEDFKKLVRPSCEQTRVFDKHGKLYLDENDDKGPLTDDPNYTGRPEIDRPVLRSLILDSLEKDTIEWGCNLEGVVANPSGSGHQLVFKNGRKETADLIVGADGAWSRVRTLLTPVKPVYTGISYLDLTITDVDTHFPKIGSLIGQGTAFILSDGRALLSQRNGNGTMRTYASVPTDEQYFDNNPVFYEGSSATIDAILSLFPGWDTSITDIIRASDPDKITPRKFFSMPIPFQSWVWSTKPGITLLGDAAHLISPFAGEGVNLAMIDAADLAEAITGAVKTSTVDMTDVIRKYEEGMLKRAEEKGVGSARNLDMIFSQDALKQFMDFMAMASSPEEQT